MTHQGVYVIAKRCNELIHVRAEHKCILAIPQGTDDDAQCQPAEYLRRKHAWEITRPICTTTLASFLPLQRSH